MRSTALRLWGRQTPVAFCILLLASLCVPAKAGTDANPRLAPAEASSKESHNHRHARHRVAVRKVSIRNHRHLHHRIAADSRPPSPGDRQTGKATWYGGKHVGHRTANGERFDPNELTAAHATLPLNTEVRVVNLTNGKVVVVRINDRNRLASDRIIDLSPRAADALGMRHSGVAMVAVEVTHRVQDTR